MSRSIRLAVNLFLIGAISLTQGGIAPALASACKSSASTTAKCSGCGHCDVEHEGEHCGCCSRKKSKPSQEKKLPKKKGCCSGSSDASEGKANPEPESNDLSACFCGQSSPPAVPASQTRVDVEQVLRLASEPTSILIPCVDSKSALDISSRSQPIFLVPHASQRLLCIWLI